MPLPRKGASAPTDADDRFDDSRHPRRTLASKDCDRREPAPCRSDEGFVWALASRATHKLADGANSLPEAGGAYARCLRPQSVTAVPLLANTGSLGSSAASPAFVLARAFVADGESRGSLCPFPAARRRPARWLLRHVRSSPSTSVVTRCLSSNWEEIRGLELAPARSRERQRRVLAGPASFSSPWSSLTVATAVSCSPAHGIRLNTVHPASTYSRGERRNVLGRSIR
jgi:hypothetical protein